jgi:hypothetical protein
MGRNSRLPGQPQGVLKPKERVAEVEEDCAEHGQVHQPDVRGNGVDVTVDDFGLGLECAVCQPKAVVQSADVGLPTLDVIASMGYEAIGTQSQDCSSDRS